MVKEKQSFFEKISGVKKPPLIKAVEKPEEKLENAGRNIYPTNVSIKEDHREVQEGQLAVDVYETSYAIIVESIIGGVNSDDINISVSDNILTIKGVREKTEETAEGINHLVSECFWGPFSRSVILPCEVDADAIKASIKKGVLKITLPKLIGSKTKKIIIEET